MASGSGAEIVLDGLDIDDDIGPTDLTALPPEFFTPLDSFDAVRHLLENLPDEDGLNGRFLSEQTKQTQTVLDAINSQLSARVMRSYGAFVHGMAQVQQLESDLVLTAMLCRSSRRHLSRVQGGMVVGGLQLLNRLRRRYQMEQLTLRLGKLGKLAEGVAALDKTLKERGKPELLPRAAELAKECRGYTGVLEGLAMRKSVVPRIDRAEERLWTLVQKTMEKACTGFDAPSYDAAVTAAITLSKVGDVVGGMTNCFAEAIKNCTKRVLTVHCLAMSRGGLTRGSLSVREAELDRGKYKDVCAMLSEEYFDSCLAHSFGALLNVLRSHHLMLQWLSDECKECEGATDKATASLEMAERQLQAMPKLEAPSAPRKRQGGGAQDGADGAVGATEGIEHPPEEAESGTAVARRLSAAAADEAEVALAYEAKRKAYKAAEAKRRVAMLIGNVPMNKLTVDQFLDAVSGISRFMAIGEAFSGSDSLGLRQAVRFKGKAYLAHFHRYAAECLEAIAASKEGAALLALGQAGSSETPVIRTLDETMAAVGGEPVDGATAAAGAAATPAAGTGGLGAVLGAADLPDEGDVTICATALNMCRFSGKYVRMMQVMPALSADALRALSGLYQLYMYIVFAVFHVGIEPGTPSYEQVDAGVQSSKLRRTLRFFHMNVIPPPGYSGKAATQATGSAEEDPTVDMQHDLRVTAGAIQLERLRAPLEGQPMFALPQAVSAMESLRRLAGLARVLKPMMESALPESAGSTLASFYNETLGAVPAMAEQTYRAISRSVLVLEPVTTAIKNRKWEVKEAAAQHNAYVDTLVQLVQKLHGNLGDLQIPKPVHAAVLEGSVESIAEQLVEAYAAIKKTTDEGRALMQRDVKVLQAALDNLVRRGALPAQRLSLRHTEEWIGALMLPVNELPAWAKDKRGYSTKALTALAMTLGAGAALKKKEQQELIELLQKTAAMAHD
eukprot:jgi/Chrpa1/14608/Chrysochromulina_OHIO_Genome00023056-RA